MTTLDKQINHYSELFERSMYELDKLKRGSFKYIEASNNARMYREKLNELLIKKSKK